MYFDKRSPKSVIMDPIDNKSSLVQLIAWLDVGHTRSYFQSQWCPIYCVNWPQWVNNLSAIFSVCRYLEITTNQNNRNHAISKWKFTRNRVSSSYPQGIKHIKRNPRHKYFKIWIRIWVNSCNWNIQIISGVSLVLKQLNDFPGTSEGTLWYVLQTKAGKYI